MAAHIEYDGTEWLERQKKMDNWTMSQWTIEHGAGRTCDKKVLCWTNCEYKLPTVISCGGYRYPHRTKVGFSYAMGFMDNTKGQNVVNDSDERRNMC